MFARYSRLTLVIRLVCGVCLAMWLQGSTQPVDAEPHAVSATQHAVNLRANVLGAEAQRVGSQRWKPPLGRPLNVVGPYRSPPSPYESGHRGIDLLAAQGEAVMAPVAGVISFAGTVVERPVISLSVDDGTIVSLEPVMSVLHAGDVVPRGGLLGTVAVGGDCSNECIHLGVRVDGHYVNPMRFFRGRPILLPLHGTGTGTRAGDHGG